MSRLVMGWWVMTLIVCDAYGAMMDGFRDFLAKSGPEGREGKVLSCLVMGHELGVDYA